MPFVVILEDTLEQTAIDPSEVAVIDDSAPDVVVIFEGTPGPKGDKGDTGDVGATGSIGDVTAVPPLTYDPQNNLISLDTSVFDPSGAASAALVVAESYTDTKTANQAVKYTFNQVSSTATWSITHNLNTNPSVVIVDSAGREVFGDIYYDSLNTLRVVFATPFSGTAYLR